MTSTAAGVQGESTAASIDDELLAMAWLDSEPFRRGAISSTDSATQRAINAFLDGGYDAILKTLGSDQGRRLMRRVMEGPPFNPTTIRKRPGVELLRSSVFRFTPKQLEEAPPAQRFILYPYLPAGTVTTLAGPGGASKTTLTAYLAAVRALGLPFFGGVLPSPGSTAIFTTEDGAEDYWRKFAALRHELGDDFNAERIAEHVTVFDLPGVPVRLVETDRGNFHPTPLADDIAEVLKAEAPDADLLIMETVSRLVGGVETNESLSILVEAAQRVCRLAQVAVLLVAHVSQDAGRRGLADQYAARGGSAIGDNGRSSIVLQRLTDDNRKEFAPDADLSREDMERIRVLAHPKSNYAPGAKPILLERASTPFGPVLRPATLRARAPATPEEQVERLRALVERLTAEGIEVTARKLRAYTDELGCSEKKLEQLLDRALATHALRPGAKVQGGGMSLLAAPREVES